jgi:hypothetical protein
LASAFFVSPFDRAALLSIDGFGDFISTMWAIGAGNSVEVLGQVEYPHSVGILYTATTQFLGFPHYGDEGKVMGLAPYGRPRFIQQFREIIKTEENGQFRLNLEYFRHMPRAFDDLGPGIASDWSSFLVRIRRHLAQDVILVRYWRSGTSLPASSCVLKRLASTCDHLYEQKS